MSTYLILVIVLALIFDYINGFHDAANSIATVVSTKVLSPFQAVLWAAFFNILAYFIFTDHAVANTIGKTVFKDYITLPVIMSGLIAAITWNLITWWFGIPSSSSHTLIGGFAGAALSAAWVKDPSLDLQQIIDGGKITKIILFIFLAPLIGMIVSMFYSFIFIQRSAWWKIFLLSVTTIGMWFLFKNLQNGKMHENIAKLYHIEKYERIIDEENLKIKHESEADIVKSKALIASTQLLLDSAQKHLEQSIPYIDQYSSKGSEWIAQQIIANVNTQDAIQKIIIEKLNQYYKTNQLLVLSQRDTSKIEPYKTSIGMVKDLTPLASQYFVVGYDSMIQQMIQKVNINPHEAIAFKEKMKIDFKANIVKSIDKADNSFIRYFICGGLIIFMMSFALSEIIAKSSAGRLATGYKRLQLLTSAGFSIGHGGNDAQKVMGIIAAALVADGEFNDIGAAMTTWWIPVACYAAIGLGTLSGGWKIVKTMGNKITKVTPLEGVTAETAGATTLFLTEQMGIPVSTTHTITGSIIGAGATKRLSAVRWGVTINLLWAWILTIPVSALFAAVAYFIISMF